MPIDVVTGPGVPASHLPFSPAVRAGGFVFVSGQASVDARGAIVADDFAGQMRRSFANVKRVLAGAGLGLAHVVQVRSYLRRAEDVDEYNRIYAQLLGSHRPARTTITGCLPAPLDYEVDVIAYVGP